MTFAFSVVDTLKRMNQVMNHDDPRFYQVAADHALNAQYLLLYTASSARDDLKDRVDVDNCWARLSARARVDSSREILGLADRIQGFIDATHPEWSANITGKAVLYAAMHRDMASIVITSFLTACLPIAVLLAMVFRSIKVGLLAMVPNLLPIVAILGLMGLMNIPLDAGSAGVASIALGVVVDGTIHLFSRYLGIRRTGAVAADAARRTIAEVGRPIVISSMVLAAGFSIFMASDLNFITYFGQLAACVIVLGLVADLLVTPALLVLSARESRRVHAAAATARSAATTPLVIALLLVAALMAPSTAGAGEPEDRGRAIAEEQRRLNSGYRDELARYRMTLLSRQGDRSERVLDVKTLEGLESGDKTLIVFQQPPDIKGTALLIHAGTKAQEDDQWFYLPALRRVKRIATPSKASSFVGSELTFEDLTPEDLARYDFRFVREEVADGTPVWVIDRVPRFRHSG